MKKILVTGWTWFIWSHTCVALLESWYEVVVLDDLSNSSFSVCAAITKITWKEVTFHKWSMTERSFVKEIFDAHSIDAVIHFAAKKSVSESCSDPFWYYETNVIWTINLLQEMSTHNVRNILFSSTWTVYDGIEWSPPFTEESLQWWTTNPYSTSKFIVEQLLADMSHRRQMNTIALRYFNPIGAHPSGYIWEDPNDIPNNLLPIVMEVASWKREKILIFWDDYDTHDGTCLRDYIHVCDVADAHVVALEALIQWALTWNDAFNIWTWVASSVRDIVNTVATVTQKEIPYQIVQRRSGDLPATYCDPTKIDQKLWRSAKRSIEEAIVDSRKFIRQHWWIHIE